MIGYDVVLLTVVNQIGHPVSNYYPVAKFSVVDNFTMKGKFCVCVSASSLP